MFTLFTFLVAALFIGGSALALAFAPPNARATRRPSSAKTDFVIFLGLVLILAGTAVFLNALILFAFNGYQEYAGSQINTVGSGVLALVISFAMLAGGVFTIRKTRY